MFLSNSLFASDEINTFIKPGPSILIFSIFLSFKLATIIFANSTGFFLKYFASFKQQLVAKSPRDFSLLISNSICSIIFSLSATALSSATFITIFFKT